MIKEKVIYWGNPMFNIPSSFRDNYEDYLTIPVIKEFMLENSIKVKSLYNRTDLLAEVEKFANESDDNLQIVLEWLDNALKEGIKNIYIRKADTVNPQWNKLIEIDDVSDALFRDVSIKNICSKNCYDEQIKLVKFEKKESNRGKVLSFYFAEMIHIHDKAGDKDIIYPLFIDLYADYGLVVGRVKSKAAMYPYIREGFQIAGSNSTNASKEINKAFEFIAREFGIGYYSKEEANNFFKKKFYRLVEEYTETPDLISQKMLDKDEYITSVINEILISICEINPDQYGKDVEADVLNLIEKYFSISHPDKNIFINGRNAYPLKIIATDEEESHLEQASGLEHPLQSKAIFFDNKKMMQKNQKCDGVFFSFERQNKKERFKVEFRMERKDCFIRCREYLKEEELQNVLFAVIEAE